MSKFLLQILGLTLLVNLSQQADVNAVFSKLTVEEKCGQMTQLTFDAFLKEFTNYDDNPLDIKKVTEFIVKYGVGSLLNAPYTTAAKAKTWQDIITTIQDIALKQTNAKIPIIFGIDSIHGANYIQEATLLPQPLNMACTFNTYIANRIGAITALETRAVGIPWNFNPVLDIGRQPLWSRTFETYGEDVHLGIEMGKAYIKGHQGDNNDLRNRSHTATCLKHFIGYGVPINGKDRTVAYIDERSLREYHLPAFEEGVKAGSPTVMINSGDVNGIPGVADGYYMNDILKGELKFDGFTVSDWSDVIRLYSRDRVVDSMEEAVRLSVMSGLDMSMVPNDTSFQEHCVNLAKKDANFANRVDDATMRILKVKDNLGLFENAYPFASDLDKINSQESQALNLQAAQESIVLAKNNQNALPLAKNTRLFVTGPTSNILRALNGGWTYTWQGNIERLYEEFAGDKLTVLKALQKLSSTVTFGDGASFLENQDLPSIIEKAKDSDVILICIGEDASTETPGNIQNLFIPDAQNELANELFKLNKKVIVLYLGGRPRVFTNIAEKADAVLIGFLPGNRGGEAIASIIYGDYNPNGKLAVTYPSTPNGYSTYDLKQMEIEEQNYHEYLYLFGHGLSYTTFEYSGLSVTPAVVQHPATITISVNVKNTGTREGKESVLLYVTDEYASISRPVKQLKAFTKITLNSQQEQKVEFKLNTQDLSFIGRDFKRIVEEGFFSVSVGSTKSRFEVKVNQETTTPSSQSTASNTQPQTTTTSSSNSRYMHNIGLISIVVFLSLFNF